jgi:hypothetical protein
MKVKLSRKLNSTRTPCAAAGAAPAADCAAKGCMHLLLQLTQLIDTPAERCLCTGPRSCLVGGTLALLVTTDLEVLAALQQQERA